MAEQVKRQRLTDFTPDDRNANLGTERGLRMLDDSLRKYGAGRSILVDRQGRVIAGNKTLERAVDVGLKDALVVRTDGKQLVVVQREDIDLDTPEGRALAIADNRVGEIDLEWDAEQINQLLNEGFDLSAFFTDDELVHFEPAAPPSLDEIEAKHGEYDERTLWPYLRVQVSPDTLKRYEALMAQLPGDTPAEQFAALLDLAEKGLEV